MVTMGSGRSLSSARHGGGDPDMLRFLGARLVVLIPTFLGVAFIAFILIRLIPGDPILMMVGERGMTAERHAALMAQYGFDRPAVVQYGQFLGGLARGDFGTSINTREPVLEEFFTRFPATVELSTVAMLLALLVGLPAGIIAAVKRGSIVRPHPDGHLAHRLLDADLLVGPAADHPVLRHPAMDAGLRADRRCIYYVEPVTGFMLIDSLLSDEQGAFRSALSHLILPSIVLGTVPLAVIARRPARPCSRCWARTMSAPPAPRACRPRASIGLHALRNALIPVVTVIGLQVGSLFGGAILTETIFAWPGVGKWLVDSISRRDYPSVQGGRAADRQHRHAGQSRRRPALRPDQPAHPARELSHGRPRRRHQRSAPGQPAAVAAGASSGTISARTRARSPALP